MKALNMTLGPKIGVSRAKIGVSHCLETQCKSPLADTNAKNWCQHQPSLYQSCSPVKTDEKWLTPKKNWCQPPSLYQSCFPVRLTAMTPIFLLARAKTVSSPHLGFRKKSTAVTFFGVTGVTFGLFVKITYLTELIQPEAVRHCLKAAYTAAQTLSPLANSTQSPK
jgi:hypothetical protein